MKCQYRNCDKEIIIITKFDLLKKYCCSSHQICEKKYRNRIRKIKKNLSKQEKIFI